MKTKNMIYETPMMEVVILHTPDIVCLSTGETEPDPEYEDITPFW